MKQLRVLIACEYSGTVRNAFAELGHDATSCDLLPGEIYLFENHKGKHYHGSVFDIINQPWDLMVGHPPCTYLSYAATRYWNDNGRAEKREDALDFFKALFNAPIDHICLENPLGYVITWKKYDQIINPWQFGEPFNKRTCLWLKNLPLLEPTNIVKPNEYYYPSGKKRCVLMLWVRGGGNYVGKQGRNFGKELLWQWQNNILIILLTKHFKPMNYEIQQALSNKADKHEVNRLNDEIRHLKNENSDLKENLNRAKSSLQNHYSALEQLIRIMVDSDLFKENDSLFNIRQYLN